jgi:tRNA threonylcarbamoyladenosine biosynthesis protein TsaE
MKYFSQSLEQTQKLSQKLAKTLKGGEVIALYGQLGAGKTTFIQKVAKALGIKRRIPSPSYILCRSYKIPKLPGKTLQHIDLYKIESLKDLASLDLEEIIADPNNITMIEWAEKAKEILPKKRIDINIVYKGERQREITILSR